MPIGSESDFKVFRAIWLKDMEEGGYSTKFIDSLIKDAATDLIISHLLILNPPVGFGKVLEKTWKHGTDAFTVVKVYRYLNARRKACCSAARSMENLKQQEISQLKSDRESLLQLLERLVGELDTLRQEYNTLQDEFRELEKQYSDYVDAAAKCDTSACINEYLKLIDDNLQQRAEIIRKQDEVGRKIASTSDMMEETKAALRNIESMLVEAEQTLMAMGEVERAYCRQ
jgi:molecular chaperone GrpE (heat shock protein)